MQILSALDAVSPAIARTRLILFTPFRKGRTWKLSATAYLAVVGAIFCPFPLMYFFFLPELKDNVGTGLMVAAVIAILAFTALFLWIFHLCSRLQFAFFDIVLNRGEFVAPAWRKYASQARKWTLVKALLGTIVTVALALPTAAYIRHLIPIMQALKPGEQPPPEFITAVFAGYGVIILGFGSLFIVGALLSDFIVPSLALEDTTLREAFRRMSLLASREPGQFTAYFFIKLGLGIAGYMAGILVVEIVFLIAILIIGAVAGLIGFLLHLMGVPNIVLIVLGVLIGTACYLFFIVYAVVLLMGAVLTFLQAYTLYFLGGRYPILGGLLELSTPPLLPPTMPPPGHSYAYAPLESPVATPQPQAPDAPS